MNILNLNCTKYKYEFFSLYYKANSQQTCLINVTLETLLRFLNWIPLGYIFETNLIGQLISTFLVLPAFRNITLKCLTEIVSINAEMFFCLKAVMFL